MSCAGCVVLCVGVSLCVRASRTARRRVFLQTADNELSLQAATRAMARAWQLAVQHAPHSCLVLGVVARRSELCCNKFGGRLMCHGHTATNTRHATPRTVPGCQCKSTQVVYVLAEVRIKDSWHKELHQLLQHSNAYVKPQNPTSHNAHEALLRKGATGLSHSKQNLHSASNTDTSLFGRTHWWTPTAV